MTLLPHSVVDGEGKWDNKKKHIELVGNLARKKSFLRSKHNNIKHNNRQTLIYIFPKHKIYLETKNNH